MGLLWGRKNANRVGGGGGGLRHEISTGGTEEKPCGISKGVQKKTQGISTSLGFSKGKVTSLKIPEGRGLGVSESISLNPD